MNYRQYTVDMEKWTKVNFFDPISIRRVFFDAGEQNKWIELSGNPAYSNYLDEEIIPLPDGVKGSFKSGRMKVPADLK